MLLYGTSHFVSRFAACRYYRNYGYSQDDVNRMLVEKTVHIGLPPLADPRDTVVTIDGGLRYGIIENHSGHPPSSSPEA